MKLNIIVRHHYNIYCLERPFRLLWLDNPCGHCKCTSKELDILVLLLWCSEFQDLLSQTLWDTFWKEKSHLMLLGRN